MKGHYDPNKMMKTMVQKMIKNISIIAIFVCVAIIALSYLGPEITIDIKFLTRIGLPSILLCISSVIIYELWTRSGQDEGRTEDDYVNLTDEFLKLSANLDYETMQGYLDFETLRRFNVEKDKLERLLKRDKGLLEKMGEYKNLKFKDKLLYKHLTKTIRETQLKLDRLVIHLPYLKSEEFDYLRYNIDSHNYKEYSPDDAKRYMRKKRVKKYTTTITLTIFGLNIIGMATMASTNIWWAVFMTLLAIVTLVMSVIGGFNDGYTSIHVVSTGIYKTAVEYINKALAYCQKTGKTLYYKYNENKPTEDALKEIEEHMKEKNDETTEVINLKEQKSTVEIQ